MKNYNYAIIKENNPYFKNESTFLDNNYKPVKYALIEKQVFSDGSEGVNRIVYSDNLKLLSNQARNYITWFNYPVGIYQNVKGFRYKLY